MYAQDSILRQFGPRNLSSVQQLISQPILVHFWWELYHYQGIENHVDLLSWEEDEIKANPTQQVFSLDDHGQGSYLRTNQTKQICGLITYMKHVFSEYMSEEVRPDPFHIFSPEDGVNIPQP